VAELPSLSQSPCMQAKGGQPTSEACQKDHPSIPRFLHLCRKTCRSHIPDLSAIMSAPPEASGYNQLRQQARTLETQTQNLFHTYSQFASAVNIPPKPSQDERDTETKIDEHLEQVRHLPFCLHEPDVV
jgi:hypothetical protein